MVAHVLKHLDLFKDWLRDRIREFYGTGDGNLGPFSVKSYLQWMLEDKVWGDMICCYLLASMWGCRLTVLQGDTCKEIRIRHDVTLKDADICLLYNSDSYNGHYSAICRDDELLLETEKVTPKQGYRKELDIEWERNVKAKDMGLRVVGDLGGRTDSDMVLISGDMFDGLLKDRDFATKVRRFVETQEGGRGDIGGSGSTGDRGHRASSRLVEESSQDDMEIDEEVRDRRIHRGETRCDFCKRDFGTTRALKNHFRKMHQGKVRFICVKCKKGFNTRMGMENHKNKCMEGEEGGEDVVTGERKKYETIQCDICNKKFVSKYSLKKHKKVFHGPRVDFPCEFCAGTPKAYIGHTTTNIQQHIKGCHANPNRFTLHCEICKDFTTFWPKKITEHKKKEHGWKK